MEGAMIILVIVIPVMQMWDEGRSEAKERAACLVNLGQRGV